MADVRWAVPEYVPEELHAAPSRLQEYLHAQLTGDVQRWACTAADLHLLPLLGERIATDPLGDVRERVNADNEAAMRGLQKAESELRALLGTALGEENVDEDVAEPLQRFAEGMTTRAPTAVEETPRDEAAASTLAQMYIARTCTQLLAEADEATNAADAAKDVSSTQMASLQRLAALVEQVPQSEGGEGTSVPLRATHELVQRRDALYNRLHTAYTEKLRAVLDEMHWPPPEHQNPDADRTDLGSFSLLGHADLEGAWADVCELQLTAAALGMQAAPSAVRTLPSVSGSETAHAAVAQPGSEAYIPLEAVTILFHPILLRFRYHFDGDRTTNRLDKPEWFLRHMLALVQMNSALFRPAPDAWQAGGEIAELTRLRRPIAPATAFRQRHIYVDTAAELLHSVLYPLRRKIHASMELLAEQPALLAHNIFQYLTFDTDLREVYRPAAAVAEGKGAVCLADEVLGNDTYFQEWLDGERVFAQRRFEAVLETPSAWTLVQADTLTDEDDLSLDTGDAEAATDAQTTTRCAGTLMNILLGVTERYQPLHSLGQRCAFVIRVQRPLLSAFATRLVRHLDAFENLSGAFSRAIPGEISSLSAGSGNDVVRGAKGLSRVAKALLSAEYVAQQLEEWSESSFFLSMGQDVSMLDRNSALYGLMLPSQSNDELDSASLISALKRGLQRGATAAATLRPLAGANDADTPTTADTEAPLEDVPGIWDSARARFSEISERSKRGIERLVVSEVLEQMRPYIVRYVSHFLHRRWDRDETPEVGQDEDAEEEEEEASSQDIPTRELLPALSKLSSLLSEMVQLLPPTLLLPLYRHIAESLSKAVVERILMPSTYLFLTFRRPHLSAVCTWPSPSLPARRVARLASCRQRLVRPSQGCS